jgi:cytochrome P450
VINLIGIPLRRMPSFTRGIAQAKVAAAEFDRLADLCIASRKESKGLWGQFKSDAPDEALRNNIKAFLAGALEATTSYASWAIAHLARNIPAQEKLFQEVADIEEYTPQVLEGAKYLGQVLDETLRLTPSLYFFPRKATVDTWVEAGDGKKLMIPKGTHILLDVWHANRHEDHWGVAATGYPALDFVPQRWESLRTQDRAKEFLHFGFGHGPRFCPGKSLGQLEVALVVGSIVKLFRFAAVNSENKTRAGVSTKPADGVLVDLSLRTSAKASESAVAV